MGVTPQKPIIDGKRAKLTIVANGTGSGSAPTSITVIAPRDGILQIQIVNSATSESVIIPDAGIHKGTNEIALTG